ncbi:MAG: hypothetical protein IPM02_08775 [Betaproteobacteria bacterium]|nr:hypothetical protein [Betaproteobacteria bacterium]
MAIAVAPAACTRSSTGAMPSHWNHSGMTVMPSDGETAMTWGMRRERWMKTVAPARIGVTGGC